MIPTGRRVPLLIALYLALTAAWVIGLLVMTTDLARFEAGVVAIGLSLALALTLGRWDDRLAATRTPEGRVRDRSWSTALIVVASIFLGVTVLTGPAHDYAFYLNFWDVVLRGWDPWYVAPGFWGDRPPNAYGPLFNVLAGLTLVNDLAPKLLFAAAYAVAAVTFVKGLATRIPRSRFATLGLMAWAWTPYAWVEVAMRGHFDVLVGLAGVAAVRARRREWDLACAGALAAGVLLKYIPIVLLPFLALDRGRVRARLVVFTTALVALGMGSSCLVWGPSTFGPLGFAATRSSTYLSIFRFLGGRYSPLRAIGVHADVDRFALPALAAALLAAWAWCRSRRVEPETAAVLAVLVTLLFYRNGFPQYQMVLLMLAADWLARTRGRREPRPALAVATGAYFGWIALFDVAYSLIGDNQPRFEDIVGLPTFVLGCAWVVCLVRSEPRRGDDLGRAP